MAKKKAETAGKPTPVARAENAVAGAAGVVADALTTAAEGVREHVVQPAAEAVGLVKSKKPAPAKGKSAAGKLMSQKVTAAPAKAGQTKGPGAARKSPAAADDLRKKMTRPPRRGR